MIKLSILFALVVCLTVGHISAQSQISDQEVIKRLFNEQYDRRVRPLNNGEKSGPVVVTVNMYVRDITKLSDNEFDIQLTYRQKWKDERLSYNGAADKYVNLISPQDLAWIPDTFFANANDATYHDVMIRNEYIRISPNGAILQSVRLSLKLNCPMDLKNFPMDRQTCTLRLASYGYTNRDILYKWEEVEREPIQLAKRYTLPTHVLESHKTSTCDSKTNTGVYSCLKVDFTLKRYFNPYLINIYIPCCTLVIIAYLSFWIHYKAITARTVLLIATQFVLAAKDFSEMRPLMSYTNALDVWIGICRTFVFVALVEFIIVHFIARREEESNQSKIAAGSVGDEEEQVPLKDDNPTDNGKQQENASSKLKGVFQKYVNNLDSWSERVDVVFRIGFPIAFAIFIIAYSISYCSSSSE